MITFTDRVAVVTGAGRGRSYSLEPARRGARMVVNDLGGRRYLPARDCAVGLS